MMQLDKLDMSDVKTVIAVAAIGALGLGMCVQLVFLFATLFKSDTKPKATRKSTRTRKKPEHLDDHVVPEQKKKVRKGKGDGESTQASDTSRMSTHARRSTVTSTAPSFFLF